MGGCVGGGGVDDGRPALFRGCTEATCEVERALAAWPTDAAGVTAAVGAHPVLEARVAVVSALIEAHPGETQALCAALPTGTTQERCQRLNERPHLWEQTRRRAPSASRPGGGPSSNEVAPSAPVAAALLRQAPSEGHGCDGATDRTGCLVQQAQALAQRKQAGPAASVCLNIAEGRWRGECLFQAAEAAVSAGAAHGYGPAVELCAAAEPFAQNCHSHTLMLLADLAPAATDTRVGAWQPFLQAIQAIRTAWSWRDPYMVEIATDRLWSEGVGRAYTGIPEIAGDPLDVLPEEAHRHVRASVARALLEQEGALRYDLAGWVQRVEAVLAARVRQPMQARGSGTFRSAPELWPADLPGEEVRPATAYLGTARRTHAPEDLQVDIAICILEAAARIPPPPERLLAEGEAHPDERVRWTTTRLRALREPPPR